jgi:hypothetical protein
LRKIQKWYFIIENSEGNRQGTKTSEVMGGHLKLFIKQI